MNDVDPESDPRRRVPTFLWWILAVLVILGFAFAVTLVGGHTPKSVGPSAGAPGGVSQP